MTQVSDRDFFRTIDEEANSIAILVRHLTGNMRSRFTDFLTTDGEKPDRQRDQEFTIVPATTRDEVMSWWEQGWKIVFATLTDLQADDLMRTVTMRGEPHTVVQAINRQLAHYAYHIGQIAFLAKHFRGAEWSSLSIPRGKSEEFNQRKLAKEPAANIEISALGRERKE